MRTTLSPRTPHTSFLYAGVAVFAILAVTTARAVWLAWDQRAGQARTAAVFELVQQRMPSRPIEAPGAIAWLRDQLGRYKTHLPPSEAVVFERLSSHADLVPSELLRAATAMAEAVAPPKGDSPAVVMTTLEDAAASRRGVSLVTTGGSPLVITRRRALEHDGASNGFIARISTAMARTAPRVDAALRGIARPVRLYAVAEDGTLVSRPWGSTSDTTELTARGEASQLATRPNLPSFAPEEFFFRFAEEERDVVRYSGFYVDLGGRGLVSTLTMPIAGPGQAGVLALDLAHAVDWDRFASTIEAPVAATIIHTPGNAPATWSSLRAALSSDAPPAIRDALHTLTTDGAHAGSPGIDPISHTVVGDVGALAAFHVSDSAWLVTWFPSVVPSFPSGAIALLGGFLGMLLAGFEVNRRRAEREADRAARALIEKQNLLNTMQVPLVVVDPNTDEIVSANQVAESIGIRRGSRFADRIAHDPRAQAHYEATQVARPGARRAYGVPIRIEASSGDVHDQFALVRSVAVTAPIEALAADERHRLAILFLVDPAADLRLLLDDVEGGAHADERRLLAGLLSHGVDPLADVLRRTVIADQNGRRSAAWLAEYLQRRIHVTAWLLDHWDAPPGPHDSVVDAAQARDTLRSLEEIFEVARRDIDLRARLGWANGPLSARTEPPSFGVSLDWPEEYEISLPVRGGLGFFLTEALSNAMRHGAPGTVPRLVVRCDRVRKELVFAVENESRDPQPRDGSRYGGLALLAGMARLFGWREFSSGIRGRDFVVSWRTPLSLRDRPGRPD